MKQYWQRNTVRNDTVKILFNLKITIIYHGFTVVTLMHHGIVAEMGDIHMELYNCLLLI